MWLVSLAVMWKYFVFQRMAHPPGPSDTVKLVAKGPEGRDPKQNRGGLQTVISD